MNGRQSYDVLLLMRSLAIEPGRDMSILEETARRAPLRALTAFKE